jgi:ATP-dependent 26S proteasome regulatory subunit
MKGSLEDVAHADDGRAPSSAMRAATMIESVGLQHALFSWVPRLLRDKAVQVATAAEGSVLLHVLSLCGEDELRSFLGSKEGKTLAARTFPEDSVFTRQLKAATMTPVPEYSSPAGQLLFYLEYGDTAGARGLLSRGSLELSEMLAGLKECVPEMVESFLFGRLLSALAMLWMLRRADAADIVLTVLEEVDGLVQLPYFTSKGSQQTCSFLKMLSDDLRVAFFFRNSMEAPAGIRKASMALFRFEAGAVGDWVCDAEALERLGKIDESFRAESVSCGDREFKYLQLDGGVWVVFTRTVGDPGWSRVEQPREVVDFFGLAMRNSLRGLSDALMPLLPAEWAEGTPFLAIVMARGEAQDVRLLLEKTRANGPFLPLLQEYDRSFPRNSSNFLTLRVLWEGSEAAWEDKETFRICFDFMFHAFAKQRHVLELLRSAGNAELATKLERRFEKDSDVSAALAELCAGLRAEDGMEDKVREIFPEETRDIPRRVAEPAVGAAVAAGESASWRVPAYFAAVAAAVLFPPSWGGVVLRSIVFLLLVFLHFWSKGESVAAAAKPLADVGAKHKEVISAVAAEGVSREHAEMVLREVVTTLVSWSDVAGMAEVRECIEESLIRPMQRPDLFVGRALKPGKGMLLFGPPGTGKTLVGRAIANELKGSTFISVTASVITSKWLGDSEKIVKALFAVARQMARQTKQPTIIFIDEIDSLLARGAEGEHEDTRKLKKQFLSEMDGVAQHAERVFVVGTTNRPQDLEDAVRRPGRLDSKLYIGLPCEAARRQQVVRLLADTKHSLTLADLETVVSELTLHFSGADVAALVKEALMIAIREVPSGTNEMSRALTMDDMRRARATVMPSVSSDDVEMYEAWNRKFGTQFAGGKGGEESAGDAEVTRAVAHVRKLALTSSVKDAAEKVVRQHDFTVSALEKMDENRLLGFGMPHVVASQCLKSKNA